jgi:hypothetical protein
MSDIPTPPDNIQLGVYADDVNTLSSHNKYTIAELNLLPSLNELYEWTQINDLKLNSTKSTATLFTTDPVEFNTELTLTI